MNVALCCAGLGFFNLFAAANAVEPEVMRFNLYAFLPRQSIRGPLPTRTFEGARHHAACILPVKGIAFGEKMTRPTGISVVTIHFVGE